jgi:hydrogenase expression/formation protein HypD
MKYLAEFRNKGIVKKLVQKIWEISENLPKIKLMEVCGTHTMSIARFGIRRLLPENVELISGPGCPVCVTPNHYLDHAVALGRLPEVILCTFGDMMRVPGSSSSLEKEKADGRDIRVVYSTLDALEIAKENPGKQIVFLGVGFETTVPTVAAVVLMADQQKYNNFTVLCAHKTMPKPMELLASDKNMEIEGFICPAHVTAIIGVNAYRFLAEKYRKACAVTGFEPIDILQGILLLLQQVKDHHPRVDNQYSRVATPKGNLEALGIIQKIFRPADAEWRGIGVIPGSGLQLKPEYDNYNASSRFSIRIEPTREHAGCICGQIMTGVRKPFDCKLFAKVCSPENPIGSCMVSSEGTCAAYYKYDRM